MLVLCIRLDLVEFGYMLDGSLMFERWRFVVY